MERRDFIRKSLFGIAGLAAAPALAPAFELAGSPAAVKAAASDKIRFGFIGLGQQAMYLLSSFIKMEDVQVVAGCDVYDIKRDRFVKRVTDYYKGRASRRLRLLQCTKTMKTS